MPTEPDSKVFLIDDELVLIFPYIPDQVAEIKRIPGAKWDRLARVWRVPVASLDQVRAFATRHDFAIDRDLAAFTIPPRADAPTVEPLPDGRLKVMFPYDPVQARAAKTAGLTFDGKARCWVAPTSALADTITFADAWGIPVPDDLRSTAATEAAARDARRAASAATDADLTIPTLARELRSYQRAGVAYALDTRRCMIADQAGTGKTAQSLAALEADNAYPALVVCPATLKRNWVNEAAMWIPHRTVEIIGGRKPTPLTGADITVVNYDVLTWWVDPLTNLNLRGLVLDESQYIKTPDAKRTKAALKLSKTLPPDALRLCLTGTPVTNRPAEFAAQFDVLGRLGEFGGRMPFLKRYAAAFQDRWGHWHFDGAAHLDELHDKARASFYLRRTKDQVMAELPPVVHAPLIVDGDPKVMVEYRKAEADIITYLAERAAQIAKDLGKSPGSAAVRARFAAESNEHLMRLGTLKRLAALAKASAVDEFIQSRVDAGNKVVVAAHHRDVVDGIADRWGGLKIQGGMNLAAVEEAKRRFQSDAVADAPVIVLSIQAAKTGHTLTAASDVLFVELPWSPADVEQTWSRCHRLGQTDSVTATYLVVDGTVDVEIHELLEAKRQVVDAATDGAGSGFVDSFASVLVGRFADRVF